MNFDPNERAVLARLADELIPAGNGLPAASGADVAGKGLDDVLAARPDLIQPLKQILLRARGRPPRDVIAEIRENAPSDFEVLAQVVPGAYFMQPRIRQALGYAGQTAQAIDRRPDYDDLLESVVQRGPIYRPTRPRE